MANSNYNRGRRFEWELKKDLEKQGYIVFRTAGSHGAYDLIALREIVKHELDVRLIQCKVTKNEKTIKQLVKNFNDNLLFNDLIEELAVKITGNSKYTIYRAGENP